MGQENGGNQHSVTALLPQTRVRRHLVHVGFGLLFAGAVYLVGRRWTAVALATAFVGAAALDWIRLRNARINEQFLWVFRSTISQRELGGPASSTWYLLGSTVVVVAFEPRTAIVSILTLAIADPAASFAGRRWGKRPFGGGTFVGSLTFFLAAFCIVALFFDGFSGGAIALVTTLVESQVRKLDDNLTVPLTTGTGLWLLSL